MLSVPQYIVMDLNNVMWHDAQMMVHSKLMDVDWFPDSNDTNTYPNRPCKQFEHKYYISLFWLSGLLVIDEKDFQYIFNM